MSRKNWIGLIAVVAIASTVVAKSIAADNAGDAKPAGLPDFKLPPGWSMEEMQACMLAGAPGEMHKLLAKDVGKWTGKNTMWMYPGADPVTTDCTSNVTSIMDGRYTKCEMSGEMPG